MLMKNRTIPCARCKTPIIFLRTRSGRAMPVNADTVKPDDTQFDFERHKSHFATCPAAAEFRKQQTKKAKPNEQ